MNVWHDLADAVITVYTVEDAFEENETREVLTEIPLNHPSNTSNVTFRRGVFELVDTLERLYSDFEHTHITIEAVFKHKYVNI
jgi:hypothetical protein